MLTKSLSLLGLVDLGFEECMVKDVKAMQKEKLFIIFLRKGVPLKHLREVIIRYLETREFEVESSDCNKTSVIEARNVKTKKKCTISLGFNESNERMAHCLFADDVNQDLVKNLSTELGEYLGNRALLRGQSLVPLQNVNILSVQTSPVSSFTNSIESNTSTQSPPTNNKNNGNANVNGNGVDNTDHHIRNGMESNESGIESEVYGKEINDDDDSDEEKNEAWICGRSSLHNFKERFTFVKKGHRDFLFCECIQIGINKSANEWYLPQCEYKTPQQVLEVPTLFDSRAVQTFKIGNGHSFGFKVHCPIPFAKIRSHFGISEELYANSFKIELGLYAKRTSSKSGSSFFYTPNKQFIVKTISKKEAKFFSKMFLDYYKHVTQSPQTLLCITCGFYTINTSAVEEEIYVIVMKNFFPPEKPLCHIFDLKGSTIGRTVSQNDRKRNDVSLKDLDFIQYYNGIPLLPDEREKFLNALERDCQFLASHEIIDYSLLLGIHLPPLSDSNNSTSTSSSNTSNNSSGSSSGNGVGGINGINGVGQINFNSQLRNSIMDLKEKQSTKIVPYFGVVDLFTKYNLNKKLEQHVKSYLSSGSLKKSDKDKMVPLLSSIDPVAYKNRLIEFVRTVVITDTETAMSNSSSADRKAREEGWMLL